MELGSEAAATAPARNSQGVPSVAQRTDRLCWSRPSMPTLLKYQRHRLSQARSPRAAAPCSLPWSFSLGSEAAVAAAQGCPDGLLYGDCCRLLLKSPPTLFCRACHDMALLGATSSRKHPAGCWAPGVDGG